MHIADNGEWQQEGAAAAAAAGGGEQEGGGQTNGFLSLFEALLMMLLVCSFELKVGLNISAHRGAQVGLGKSLAITPWTLVVCGGVLF